MDVKTYTKEKFTVIEPTGTVLTDNMAAGFNQILLAYLQKTPPHIVINLKNIEQVEEQAATSLATLQQNFYEHNCSFVICELQQPVEDFLDSIELLELMNVTPTESEAWDIVQMEEIERELMGDDFDD